MSRNRDPDSKGSKKPRPEVNEIKDRGKFADLINSESKECEDGRVAFEGRTITELKSIIR